MRQFKHKNLFFTEVKSTLNHVGVLFFPSAFGIAPDVMSQLRHISQHAGHVVAFDPFFESDPGFADYQDMNRVMERVKHLDRNQLFESVQTAISYLKENDCKKILMVGVCFGGPFTLQAAANKLIDAGVIWHGSRMENYLDLTTQISCPLSFHFGANDPITPTSTINTIKKSFEKKLNVSFYIHPLANHGFSHSLSPAFNALAESAGMASVEELCHRIDKG